MPDGSIQRELGIGEVISQTFQVFRRDFVKYVTIFLVLEAVIGTLSALVDYYIVLPTLPIGATTQELMNSLPTYLGALFTLVLLLILVSAIFGTIAGGTAVKMTSELIENREPNLTASVRFTASKILSIWAVGLIVVIVVSLGLIALIVPGIILAIMLSLAFPVLLIENLGVLGSMGRSRKLVGGRWLKSLAFYILLAIIVGIASEIVSLMTSPLGSGFARTILNSVLSAFYLPITFIAITIYYYSNNARLTPVQPPPLYPSISSVIRYCPSCGEPVVDPNQAFCSKCGYGLRPR